MARPKGEHSGDGGTGPAARRQPRHRRCGAATHGMGAAAMMAPPSAPRLAAQAQAPARARPLPCVPEGELGQTCPVLASSADAPAPRRHVPAPPRAGFFLNVMSWRLKKRHTEVRLPGILCLRIAQTTSSSVKSGCASISASKKSACSSSGEVLPPRGLAAQLPVAR